MVRAALAPVDPGLLVSRAFDATGGWREPDRVHVIAAGKAAPAMARAAAARLGSRMASGLAIAVGKDDAPPGFELIVGGHPLPTIGSDRGGRRALEVARAAAPGDDLLLLLSGGASALMAAPVSGITLDEKRAVTEVMLRAGAPIEWLNTVRKHLSEIKGGRLAAATRARCTTWAMSDVVGDLLPVIGSGPCVADPTTFADALDALRSLAPASAVPPRVIAHLERGARGEIAETPKPGDPALARSTAAIIGSARDALDGAAAVARRRGYDVVVLPEPIVGDAKHAARRWAAAVSSVADRARQPACVLSAGETTVRVVGHGRGGRNLEFALAAAADLHGVEAVWTSLATDGADGTSGAAGALVDAETLARAHHLGIDVEQLVSDSDTRALFAALDDLIITGPTGTNVGDVQIALVRPLPHAIRPDRPL